MAGLTKREGYTNRTIPIKTDVYEQIKQIAHDRGISFNALANFALRTIIANEGKNNAKIQDQ